MLRDAPFLVLDDARPGHEEIAIYSDPIDIIRANDASAVDAALSAIEAARGRGLHCAGYFSYELGYLLEPRLAPRIPARREVPLLWFGVFRDRQVRRGTDASAWFEENFTGRAYGGPLHFSETRESYDEKFRRAQDYLRAGDIYQVNLTFPAEFAFAGDPLALYARLRARGQGGHSAYIEDGVNTILSLSPELFFTLKEGVITARPMKGTAPRVDHGPTDDKMRDWLLSSEKNRAENLMIVDLIRNDLGRIAKTGTVKTRDLFAVESYPTVHQMVSTVSAELREHIVPADLLNAVFPCGSITGAPKIRAMEIIRELEPAPRGIYCGAIGAFAPDGSASFNVAIRTLTIRDNRGTLGVGGAVTADSESAAEFEECVLKARYYTEGRPPIALIETMRWEPGAGFVLADLHLDRLARSAALLGLPFDRARFRAELDNAASDVAAATMPMRFRFLFDEQSVTSRGEGFIPTTPQTVWRYGLSDHRVPSNDLLARHKTDWRTLYDAERALWSAKGADEVLFLNEKDELAEGGISNVFLTLEGRLITPPLSSGALDGVLRRSLIERGVCAEETITLAMLARAESLWFGNALRGLVRAVPLTPA